MNRQNNNDDDDDPQAVSGDQGGEHGMQGVAGQV
jgi:hypothetical protein